MIKSNLTDGDRNDIANVACDLETGNFLLRPRPLMYRVFMRYVGEILDRGFEEGNVLEEEIMDYFNACGSRDKMGEYEKKYETKKNNKEEE